MSDDKESWAAHVRRMVAQLQSDNFQPWEINRPGGRTLKQALFEMVPQERKAISYYLAQAAVRIETANDTRGIEQRCWYSLLQRLRDGEVTMRGIADGQIESIPAILFDDAVPDIDANRITCGGRTFVGVRVFDLSADDSADAATQPSRPGPKTDSHTAMRRELTRLLEPPGSGFSTKKAAYQAVFTAMGLPKRGCSYDVFCRVCSDLLEPQTK